jgi:hypothetical protein
VTEQRAVPGAPHTRAATSTGPRRILLAEPLRAIPGPLADEAGRALERARQDPHLQHALLSVSGIARALAFLDRGRAPPRPGRFPRKWYHSGNLKHIVESWCAAAGARVYISTGDIQAAALYRGCELRRLTWPSPRHAWIALR